MLWEDGKCYVMFKCVRKENVEKYGVLSEKDGNLVKTEDYTHNVAKCERCKNTIEPKVSEQWFVSMKNLAKRAADNVRNGETRFVPQRYEKQYFHWLDNIQDWCISRQLWWGIRIPVWYKDDQIKASVESPGEGWVQDKDVLDTWFSSALWPFSTLGWPNNTEELNYYYPTSVLVTGYDIIFFWVVRMAFAGMFCMGETPFEHVLIHGLVRDSEGRKMSKSLGNGIDPLEVIDQYGADALRFMLATGNSPGNDMRFYMERVEAARNFANKLWNASRFVLMNFGEGNFKYDESKLTIEDKWIKSKLNKSVMLLLAVTLHNIPEGMAVGVTFAGALLGNTGITVAGATLPVVAFLLLGIYGRNIFLIISTIVLGIGHIGIHLNHKKELE